MFVNFFSVLVVNWSTIHLDTILCILHRTHPAIVPTYISMYVASGLSLKIAGEKDCLCTYLLGC